MKTVLTIDGSKFRINGVLTYREIENCPKERHGMLMNQRMIQGVFDDAEDVKRFNRFGRTFDAEKNTEDLIRALPEWYAYGLRAITVGFQGGGPCFTMNSMTINNNPYSPDGRSIDPAYLNRMKKIIDAADEIGMVVIVSCFYGPQSRFLKDDRAVMEATKTTANWLRDQKFTNVIIEIANEHDIEPYKVHPILFNDSGIVELIEIARRESGGMPVGCSSTGAYFLPDIPNASDVVLIHGNNMPRQIFYNQICQVKEAAGEKPIVCNEDSQALSNFQVALDNDVSWGYYNNMTEQEPPTVWGIKNAEDRFFAERMAEAVGIQKINRTIDESFEIQGLDDEQFEGKRWLRIASVHPEMVQHVEWYRNGELMARAYDDPFSIHFLFNWLQLPVEGIVAGEKIRAVIRLVDGSVVEKEAIAE